MSMAWEVTLDDIEHVLDAHGMGERAQEIYDEFDDQYRVEKAVLYFTDMDDQTAAANSEIEDILMEAGVITGEKKFKE
jgi:hypothetical protein